MLNLRPEFPCAKRVRRLLYPQLIADAYEPSAPSAMPEEIIDLDDGTRVCEWHNHTRGVTATAFETAVQKQDRLLDLMLNSRPLPAPMEYEVSDVRRIRYAGEADMWRALHALASRASGPPVHLTVNDATLAAWQTGGLAALEDRRTRFEQNRHWQKTAAERALESEKISHDEAIAAFADARKSASRSCPQRLDKDDRAKGNEVAYFDYTRNAWLDRPAALEFVCADTFAQLRIEHVPIPGDADDRAIDSTGKRNGGPRKPIGARLGTNANGPVRSARATRRAPSPTIE